MQLIYIWVEKYQCIKQQGFSFDSKYDVEFKRYKKPTLSVNINNKSIDTVLYGKNISVTAIVGDNGVGKSTVLDLVRNILFNILLEKEATGFMIFNIKGKIKLYSFWDNKVEISSKSLKVDITKSIESSLDDSFGLIYFSELLDLKYYNNDYDDGQHEYIEVSDDIEFEPYWVLIREWEQYNISTSFLLKHNKGNILDFFHSEIRKQLSLIKSLNRKEEDVLPFSLPSNLTIDLKFLGTEVFKEVLDDTLLNYEYNNFKHHGENNTSSFTIGLLKEMDKIYRKKNIRNIKPVTVNQIIEWDIFIAFLYDLLRKRLENREERDNYEYIDNILVSLFNNSIPEEDSFFSVLASLFEKNHVNLDILDAYIQFYHELKSFLCKENKEGLHIDFKIPLNILSLLKESSFHMLSKDELSDFSLYMSLINEGNEDIDIFEKFYMKKIGMKSGLRNIDDFFACFDNYEKIASGVDFLMFSWGMSSGENSIFSLFSRFNNVMENNGNKLKNIVFLLDELDCNYHPKWQQLIMSSLTDFIRKMYPKIFFQIIITTHSPVLLSDIPKSNTIFMKAKDFDDNKEINHEQTFAANIATLYYDSFFMENGSIGELSRKSIDSLIIAMENMKMVSEEFNNEEMIKQFVNMFWKEKFSKLDEFSFSEYKIILQQIEKLIDSIGEDIWRYKLKNKFNSFHFNNDKADKTEEILSYIDVLRKTRGEDAVNELLQKIKGVDKNDSN